MRLSKPTRICKLCGAETARKFSLHLVDGLDGDYFECQSCQFLQSHHLDSKSPDELQQLYDNERNLELDSGAAWRQACVVNRIEQLVKLGLITNGPGRFKLLDFGCGSGFIASYLAHQFGWQAISYDQYARPVFSPQFALHDWADVIRQGPYNLIVASEVFEHFIDPKGQIDQLRMALAEDHGFMFITTGLYLPDECNEQWNYLAPQSGQHVSFYSRKSMYEVRRLLDAGEVYQVGAEYEWLFVKLASAAPYRSRLRRSVCSSALRTAANLGLLRKIV
ncbi:MAG: hypothetical protein HONDAALG_02379 [Gammaproteobacteria bacterium]|nr:hypothetical protein [Gammaproteobacteria bacterium]